MPSSLSSSARCSPGWMGVRAILFLLVRRPSGPKTFGIDLLVIIDNLHIDRAGRTFRPFEANPPLIIDADAVLARPAAFKGFQPIAADRGKVFQAGCRLQAVEP